MTDTCKKCDERAKRIGELQEMIERMSRSVDELMKMSGPKVKAANNGGWVSVRVRRVRR